MMKHHHSVTVNADGYLYKCYCLVGRQGYQKQHISNVTIDDLAKHDVLAELCNISCEVKSLCEGGCPHASYIVRGSLSRDCQKNLLLGIAKQNFLIELKNLGILDEIITYTDLKQEVAPVFAHTVSA